MATTNPDLEAATPLLEPSPAGTPANAQPSALGKAAIRFYAWLSHVATCVLLGGVSAICLKIFGPPIAYAIVGLFLLVLVLAYYGHVNLNWGSFANLFRSRLDLNGDGRVGFQDIKMWLARVYSVVITFGLSSVGGFALGFWLALKVF